jgi:hypothetical protein
MRPRKHRNRLSIKHTNARYDIGCWRNWLGEKHTHIVDLDTLVLTQYEM